MSFHRPITSALEAIGCLGSLVNPLIGTRNCLKCILEDGETAFIQDVNLLLQHLQIEHPVGQYVANACHSFNQRIGTGTKTLLLFTSLLTKAAAGLQYQGMPLSLSLPFMQTCLEACVEHLKEVLIPVRLKFHPLNIASGREGLGQEITRSEPCCQKEQVFFHEKDRNIDEDLHGIENSNIKTDTQRVNILKQICSCFETKNDCDKCLKMTQYNNYTSALDRSSIKKQDKHKVIDIETSDDKASEFTDIFVNYPTKPMYQEIKGLDAYVSKPEGKRNIEDHDVSVIHLQMKGIHANESDDDDINWFFECGVKASQEIVTKKAFLQNNLLKRGYDTGKDNISKVEESGNGMGKDTVSPKNVYETITFETTDALHHATVFKQSFDDTLKSDIEQPLNSIDRNKEIPGCCVILEKAGDLCHLPIERKTDFRDTVFQSIPMCKMQKCIGSGEGSAVFDGHLDNPGYLTAGQTMDYISHKCEDEFDAFFEFEHCTVPVFTAPLVSSAYKNKVLSKYKDQIKISLKGLQDALDEFRPNCPTLKHDSEGYVSFSKLQNNSRHFKTMDSSLKAMTGQIQSDKLSVQMNKCTNLNTSTVNQECSKYIHLNPNTVESLGYHDKSAEVKEDRFLSCLEQVHSQLDFPRNTKEETKNASNSNYFGNTGSKMVSLQRLESFGNNKLWTHSQISDDIQNICRSRPLLALHSRHLNDTDHKEDDKSPQSKTFIMSKTIGKYRSKATSDICPVSEVNSLQEFNNLMNAENIQRGQEGNEIKFFDSKMSNIENDQELKNVDAVNERDNSSVKQISQKRENISNALIDSLLEEGHEGENNVCRGRLESNPLYPGVYSFVSKLGHTNDEDIVAIISRAVVYQSTLPVDSITSRFDLKKVYCHTIQNSLRQAIDLVDGLLLSVSTDQMMLVDEIQNKPCRALMVNGTVSPTFQHIGHKTSMQGPIITHSIKPIPTNQWLQDVRNTLQQLRIDVILSKGPVCEEVALLASEYHVLVIENIAFKALQALSLATEKELVVYVDMAAEINVCQVDSLSPWRSDWMDHGKTPTDRHYVTISVDRNILQTVVISEPCQGQADIKEQEFWQCASRVASSLNFGSAIPGGGSSEEYCMKFCQKQSDTIKVLNDEKSLFQSVIWEAMAIVFNEVKSTINKNTQQLTFNVNVPKDVSGSFSDTRNPAILDDYASKMAAWKTAFEIASNILQLDMYIVTGIMGMNRSDLVVL